MRATEMGIEHRVLSALRTCVHAMCVGPVTARPLVRLGVPTSAPERMRLGALARHITDELPLLQSRTVRVAGHALEIRGTCVLVDGVVRSSRRRAWRPSARFRTALAQWCRAETSQRAPGYRHRHPRRRDGRASTSNSVGGQAHRLDGREAWLSACDGRVPAQPYEPAPGGARHPQAAGRAMIGDVAGRVSATLGQTVHVAFVDVLGPTPSDVLRGCPTARSLVPAFLAGGYHVTTDYPRTSQASGHPDVVVTDALGPGPRLVRVLTIVSLNPAGAAIIVGPGCGRNLDPYAQRDLHTTPTALGDQRVRVELAFAATGTPRVAERSTSCADRGATGGGVVVAVLPDDGRVVPGPAPLRSRPVADPRGLRSKMGIARLAGGAVSATQPGAGGRDRRRLPAVADPCPLQRVGSSKAARA